MTIEPQHAVTVHIPSVRPEAERTLADYQADLIRRFGRLPSWPELAKRENSAMRARVGLSNMERQPKANVLMRTPEQEQRRVEKLRETMNAKAAQSKARIMDALGKTKTVDDLVRETGLSRSAVACHLGELLANGRVQKAQMKGVGVWLRVDGVPVRNLGQAVPITVRGRSFPSLSACARHFGVSTSAIEYAKRHGREDYIGTRKRGNQEAAE